jgi:hypothetical protein
VSSRSSIFSSESRPAGPFPLATAAWTLAFLLALRIGLGFGTGWVERVNRVGTRPDIEAAAAYLRETPHGAIGVVFLGSSRFQSGIDRERWARRAGLPTDRVVNLAVESGGVWETSRILSLAGGVPRGTQRVVIEVEPWMFNRNARDPVTLERIAPSANLVREASLAQRLAHAYPDNVALLRAFAWPMHLRQPLASWFAGAARARTEVAAALPGGAPYHGVDGRPTRFAAMLASAPAFEARNVAVPHLVAFEPSRFALDTLARHVDGLARSGVAVALVQPPVRSEYFEYLEARPALMRNYQDVLARLGRLASERVSVIVLERATQVGFSPQDFIDYGHFNRRGARRFTDLLFDRLAAGAPGTAAGPQSGQSGLR